MPTYEYECNQNAHRFEVKQAMKDEPIKLCPVCGSTVHKVFNPASIIFKGSGWYKTDSRKPESSAETASSGGSDKKSEGKSETKGENKTEGTNESKSDKPKPVTENKTEAKSEKQNKESKANSGGE